MITGVAIEADADHRIQVAARTREHVMKTGEITRRSFCSTMALGAAATTVLATPALPQAPLKKMSMGSVMTANHPASTFVEDAVQAIKKETNGAVEINFFPNSMLGSEASMQSQLRSGAIDFAVHSCTFLQTVVPVAGIPGIPYAYNDYNTLWASLDGDLGAYIKAALEKAGMTAFKIVDNGFRHTTTSVRPINTVADFEGLKIRVPPGPLLTSLFAALGAAPVTITLGELYTSLQSKVADGMEASLVNLEALKAYEVQKYCSKTGHTWDGLWLMVRTKSWKEFPQEVREVIQRNFESFALRQQKEFARMDTDMEGTLQSRGLIFNQPERGQFRKKLEQVGYYKEWKAKFGAEAWAKLEQYTGPLGA
jgi:TRAP-type transport system periplasmic protein